MEFISTPIDEAKARSIIALDWLLRNGKFTGQVGHNITITFSEPIMNDLRQMGFRLHARETSTSSRFYWNWKFSLDMSGNVTPNTPTQTRNRNKT